MCRSTVTEPPRLLTRVGDTEVETNTGSEVSCVGVTEFDATDGSDVPTPFVAATVNVYACPLVSPGTSQSRPAPSVGAGGVPGFAVAVYPVMLDPPSEVGGFQ